MWVARGWLDHLVSHLVCIDMVIGDLSSNPPLVYRKITVTRSDIKPTDKLKLMFNQVLIFLKLYVYIFKFINLYMDMYYQLRICIQRN